jgi:hypothetical protein
MTPATSHVRVPRSRGAKLRRATIAVAGFLAAATAVIGVLHAPFARSLLMRLGGCPMYSAKMTAAQMDRARSLGVSGNQGTRSAPVRPALGFALDATTLAQVHAWAAHEHVECEDAGPALVTCSHVSPVALGRPAVEGSIDELGLAFDVRGHLVNVTTLRTHMKSRDAASAARDVALVLSGTLGPADKVNGSFDANRLAVAGIDSLATVRYRYSDYFADVTAMTLPSSGASVREHYMSANN